MWNLLGDEMKTALITTTINVPDVLRLYRALDPVFERSKFFIALDQNSDLDGIAKSTVSDPMMSWLTPDYQRKWKCSEPIGWRNIQRRNIATLEALAWGADILVLVDDDNIPCGNYFMDIWRVLNNPHNGLRAEPRNGWFNPYAFAIPPTVHRGFPRTVDPTDTTLGHVTGARIGVAAGICLGDPDIDAVTRMAQAPIVMSVTEPLRAGIVTDPRRTRTVFNSQNTAFIRELAPAMFMLPGCGRFDDILASLICQHVMKERGLHVHFGMPLVWQTRNPHNLLRDLQAEVWGMEHVLEFAKYLDKNPVDGRSIFDYLGWLYDDLLHCAWWPKQASEAGLAWIEDCRGVL